jgi:hypothetical protein
MSSYVNLDYTLNDESTQTAKKIISKFVDDHPEIDVKSSYIKYPSTDGEFEFCFTLIFDVIIEGENNKTEITALWRNQLETDNNSLMLLPEFSLPCLPQKNKWYRLTDECNVLDNYIIPYRTCCTKLVGQNIKLSQENINLRKKIKHLNTKIHFLQETIDNEAY